MASSVASNYPVQFTVTPTQSSFFAGEELRCLITFTNLRQPVPQSQPLPSTSRFPVSNRAASHAFTPQGHNRSHTVDLRNPVVSGKQLNGQRADHIEDGDDSRDDDDDPFAASTDSQGNVLPSRKRIIGRNATPSKSSSSSRGGSAAKHAKSASMAFLGKGPPLLSPASSPIRPSHERSGSLSGPPSSSRAPLVSFDDSSVTSSPVATRSGSRKPSSTIHAAHPHSRKESVFQMQTEDLSAAFELHGAGGGDGTNGNGHTLYAQSVNPSEVSLASTSQPPTPRIPSTSLPQDQGGAASSFYNLGQNDTMDSVVRDQLTQWSRGAPQPQSRVSSGNLLTPNGSSAPASSSSPLFPQQKGRLPPGTEVVYWSFAQFSGSYEIDESMIKPAEFEDVKRRLAYGGGVTSPSPSGTPRLMGGGDLGYGNSWASNGGDAASTGWAAYLRSVLGGGGTGSSSSSNGGGSSMGHGSSLSLSTPMATASPAGRHRRTGSTMHDLSTKTMLSKTIPLYSSPPSILAVDLHLSPGQSKTYSFSLRLPADLPPSYYGRSVKFTYELVVGTNRLDGSRGAAALGNQRSRLIKIPLRLYNHVNMEGVRPFFDLTNPVVVVRDAAVVQEEQPKEGAEGAKGAPAPLQSPPLLSKGDEEDAVARKGKQQRETERGRRALRAYAASLLASCPAAAADEDDSDGERALQEDDAPTDYERAMERMILRNAASGAAEDGALIPRRNSAAGSEVSAGGAEDSDDFFAIQHQRRGSGVGGGGLLSAGDADGGVQSCKGAIEVISRNSQKVSYDISKDGQIAAVLTLVKSKYRLGDTILGVVSINHRRPPASNTTNTAPAPPPPRVVRIAALLESYEEVEPTLSTLPPARSVRMTRKVHAEHHESTLDVGQTSFSLPIPSGATPDFATSGVKLHWTVRISFLTTITTLPPAAPAAETTSSSDATTAAASTSHLTPCSPDGYSLYHTSYRAVPSLCGPSEDPGGGETRLEIVECAVPVSVLPNSTRFKARPVSFAA